MSKPATSSDVVVIGAGIIGACCALYLARAGLSVVVVDRSAPAGGTSGAGEGNLLVSDKVPGPELELARRSLHLWRELATELPSDFEFEPKGGLVVAHDAEQWDGLGAVAEAQRRAGVTAEPVEGQALSELEPRLTPALAGGVFYPEDCQVQPMQATWAILRAAVQQGASLFPYTEMTAIERSPAGAVTGISTTQGRFPAPLVVNAAGPWSAELVAQLGSHLPVRPRRGHILVTEPLPQTVHHKVYDGDYVATVTGDDATACSAVVEGTASGTILIGSSREFVDFERSPGQSVMAEIARRAIRLFPFLAGVRVLRTYLGFRPSTPDHLPIIGPDPAVPGLYHATGHEGAGIGLAPATGELLAGLVMAQSQHPLDPAPFLPGRGFPETDA